MRRMNTKLSCSHLPINFQQLFDLRKSIIKIGGKRRPLPDIVEILESKSNVQHLPDPRLSTKAFVHPGRLFEPLSILVFLALLVSSISSDRTLPVPHSLSLPSL